jgi:hypothetical protein
LSGKGILAQTPTTSSQTSTSSIQAPDSSTPELSVRYALQAGLGFAFFSGHTANGAKFGESNIVRFRGGGNVEVPVSSRISFRPELLLSLGGYKVSDSGSESSYTHLSYLKVPTDFVFSLLPVQTLLGKDYLRLGVGTYFAYAIHGKFNDESQTSKVHFTNKGLSDSPPNYAAYFKHWDAGLNYFLEFAGSNFYTELGSSLGLTNIKPRLENQGSHQAVYRNGSINISYGWRF